MQYDKVLIDIVLWPVKLALAIAALIVVHWQVKPHPWDLSSCPMEDCKHTDV